MKTGPLMKVGRYEVLGKVASGGMATVYRAVQTGVGGFRSVVALKILHAELAVDANFRKMFLEEARIGALLNHRCLLQVLDYGEEEGISYLVSEYFPSISVEDLTRKVRKVPLAEALYIAAEAAEGLAALHAARDMTGKSLGLVHRDVSPHNLLVGWDGRIKVIDFGIVKKAETTEKTRSGVVKGKCRYMSPEQASGKAVGVTSDLYSLGVTFLRALSGTRPHGSGSDGEIMARARAGLDITSQLNRMKIPENVADLARRMLAIEPSERFGSALELTVELRRALASLSSPYDMHTFSSWLKRTVPEPEADDSTGVRTGRGGARKRRLRPDGEESIIMDPTALDGGGIHPRWVFAGIGALFAVAAIVFGFKTLFGG